MHGQAITPLTLISGPQGSNQLVTSPEVSIVVINLINIQNIKENYSKIF